MENKPQNLFDKLDKQGEEVEDIAKKLEGVSINDLYALAKRTWDYGDYQTAQKYYNHISLLRPLEWKAPLYASLCNYKGYHKYSFWINTPKQLEKIYISTIKYINSLDLEKEKKENEMGECLEIIKDDIFALDDMYFDYKDTFDDYDLNYIFSLQECIFNTYTSLKEIDLESTKKYLSKISIELLDLIDRTQKIYSNINKESFDELIAISDNKTKIDYDVICKKSNAESIAELSYEEINEIKLKGTMYYEYNDKIISKRIFLRNLTFGIFLIAISIFGIVYFLINEYKYTISFAFSFLYGITLTIQSFLFKNKIKCSSILCNDRIKNRLTSEGNIVTENKLKTFKILTTAGCYIQMFASLILSLTFIESNYELSFKVIFIVCATIALIVYFISTLNNLTQNMNSTDGSFSYTYKNKNYKF